MAKDFFEFMKDALGDDTLKRSFEVLIVDALAA